jgi:hypothetical protein
MLFAGALATNYIEILVEPSACEYLCTVRLFPSFNYLRCRALMEVPFEGNCRIMVLGLRTWNKILPAVGPTGWIPDDDWTNCESSMIGFALPDMILLQQGGPRL